MAQLSQLSIIVVSWNVRDLLATCLASLPRGPQVIVVDNASSDGSADMVAAQFPEVALQANDRNRGFTGGNNDGLRLATGSYVLFLNPDTVVDEDALPLLVEYLDAHPSVGVVGPQLRYGDGTLQSSRRRFPTLVTALFESTPLAWHWPPARNPWAMRYRMEDRPAGATQEVDWLVGAALLTRRAVLDQVGGFDEGYFMYSEELDWQRRVKQAGWHVVYLPDAIITHYEGKSSEQAVAAAPPPVQPEQGALLRKISRARRRCHLAACPVGNVHRRMGLGSGQVPPRLTALHAPLSDGGLPGVAPYQT